LQENFSVPMSKPDITEVEIKTVVDVLRSGWPTQGRVTEQFESLLADYFSSNAVAVNSGSSALLCALIAHGIKPGDKVVVPDFTFVAAASIPKILGAELIVADVDRKTFNIDPETVKRLVNKRTDVRAVIVVDVAGLPVNIDAFTELSKRFGFILIEDAAEALGAEYKHRKLGSFDHTTIFSFQIAKQLTTIEGGCISTTDEAIAKRCRLIRNYGRDENARYVHQFLGLNLRITDLQSAIGVVQFKKLESSIRRRNEVAMEYRKKIEGLRYQTIPSYVSRHSYMLFFAIAKDKAERDMCIDQINDKGVDVRGPWTPIHMQPCFPEFNKVECPNAEYLFDRAFTLPIYNKMTSSDVAIVLDRVRESIPK
jgi:perosamine synthetase